MSFIPQLSGSYSSLFSPIPFPQYPPPCGGSSSSPDSSVGGVLLPGREKHFGSFRQFAGNYKKKYESPQSGNTRLKEP